MAQNKRLSGLGRGLSALLEDAASGATPAVVSRVAVAEISANPLQPRRRFDPAALDELTESVRTHGVLQPILVRPVPGGYEIVAGERRWRAAQAAQLHDIPAMVRPLNDGEAFEIALIENIQRSDLNAIEEARSFRRLAVEFGHSQEALAKAVGKSRSHVANLLRLLDLPELVQDMVEDGRLSMGHARAVAGAPDPASAAQRVIDHGLSVRAAEQLTATLRAKPRPRHALEQLRDANVEALENQLGEALGMPVALSMSPGGGSGSVSIRFASIDQLDWLMARMAV